MTCAKLLDGMVHSSILCSIDNSGIDSGTFIIDNTVDDRVIRSHRCLSHLMVRGTAFGAISIIIDIDSGTCAISSVKLQQVIVSQQ